jgi:hypothetical protein|tara:strand:+ start:9138 stop:9533 length:396 start_codon:yes stop_codon:yes gene_type:complete
MTNEEMAQHKLVLVMTKKEVTNLLSEVIRYAFAEIVTNTKIICDNCGWSWNKADGGDDLYICHKCNHNNTPNALENFKDGKKKGKSKPGRVKKSGASCNGSVASLRAKAKKYGGEKGKMYHWCANMKGGKK